MWRSLTNNKKWATISAVSIVVILGAILIVSMLLSVDSKQNNSYYNEYSEVAYDTDTNKSVGLAQKAIIQTETHSEKVEKPVEKSENTKSYYDGKISFSSTDDAYKNIYTNNLTYVNGVKVNRIGEFYVNNLLGYNKIKIRCLVLICPNENCSSRDHLIGGTYLSGMYIESNKKVRCEECDRVLDYSYLKAEGVMYECPVCNNDVYCNNFCSECGLDLRPINDALYSIKWESR